MGGKPRKLCNDLTPQQHLEVFLEDLIDWLPKTERRALRDHLRSTPQRVVRMYQQDILIGYSQKPEVFLAPIMKDGYDEIVLVKDIEFSSFCAHHLLPFMGKAHVAYLPKGRIVGISKLARLVFCFSHRLQIQERLTEQVANTLMKLLKPKGAACVMEATHLCMACRGVRQPTAKTITSTMLGAFRRESSARTELLALIYGRGPA